MLDGWSKASGVENKRLTTTERGFSQAFYREKVHEKHFGFKDLESFMVGFWETWATSKGIHATDPGVYDRIQS